jgi:hypothetical protein
MNLLVSISNVNYLAVLVSGVAAMAIGYLWYSPLLFANTWMKENGFTEESMKGRNPAVPMLVSFLLMLVIAFVMAIFFSGPPDFLWGLAIGALAGIGWIAASIGVLYLFEAKSMKLFLINAGYNVVTFIVMGGIIGAWK